MGNVVKLKSKYDVSASSLTAKITQLFTRDTLVAPKVWYSNIAWQKIRAAVQVCTMEVGWLGTVETVDGGYLITDIFVPKQAVTGAETDILPEAMADLAMSLDNPEQLYYWGHSHVNMAVGPSGQDQSQTAEYLEHVDVFIRGIYNKHGASKVDVFDVESNLIYEAVNNGVQIQPLPPGTMDNFLKGIKEDVLPATVNNNTSKKTESFRESSDEKGEETSKVNKFIVSKKGK